MGFKKLIDLDLLDRFLGKVKELIPTKTSDLTNDSGFLTSYTETDPTVPSWAKQSSKPTYTASEVGLGNLDNVRQYSASNPPPYPVTSVNGSTGAVTISIPEYTPASANPFMDGTVAVGTSVKYAREDHRHPSDTNKVSMSGNETVAGDKTFSGTTSLTADSIYPASTGTAIPANAAAIIQSPIPKYLWHDVFAFCRDCTPTYYTTADGTTWTEETLDKNLFLHKMAWGRQIVISSTIKGSRWIWQTTKWNYSSATWLLIGVSYTATNAYFDISLETADSSGNWTTLLSKENCYYSSKPVWFKTNTPGSAAQVRLTIIRNANDATTNELPITSIRWLASRWGDQGRGEEFEYPYQWNENLDIYPTSNNVSNLGTSSVKWNTVYASTFSGNATSATKATKDESGNNIKATYAASASISGNTLTLKNKNNETLSTATIPSELPSVSSSDNDKVLKVVSGAWAAATDSGGGSVEIIRLI